MDGNDRHFGFAQPTTDVHLRMVLSYLAGIVTAHQHFACRDLFGWLNAPFEGPLQLANAAQAQLPLGIPCSWTA
jgi:hypothetical protein